MKTYEFVATLKIRSSGIDAADAWNRLTHHLALDEKVIVTESKDGLVSISVSSPLHCLSVKEVPSSEPY